MVNVLFIWPFEGSRTTPNDHGDGAATLNLKLARRVAEIRVVCF
jgi:hypothetical protein